MNVRYLLILFVITITITSIFAKVYQTKDEVLKKYFSDSVIEKKVLFLSNDEVKIVQNISKTKLNSKLFIYYVVYNKNNEKKYVSIESCIVKTKPVIIMVVINNKAEIENVEVLAFYEPEEHLPSKKWFELFKNKKLNDNLQVKKDIDAISGATFTTKAITNQIRVILAIYETMILKK